MTLSIVRMDVDVNRTKVLIAGDLLFVQPFISGYKYGTDQGHKVNLHSVYLETWHRVYRFVQISFWQDSTGGAVTS